MKRARVYSKPADDTGLGANRIVLRIRKTSEELSSSRSETSNSNGSSHQLTVQIKEPLVALREDDENDSESQSSVIVFDMLDSAEPTSMDTKEENECVPETSSRPLSSLSTRSLEPNQRHQKIRYQRPLPPHLLPRRNCILIHYWMKTKIERHPRSIRMILTSDWSWILY